MNFYGMRRVLLLVLPFCGSAVYGQTQGYAVNGTLIDSLSQTAEPYATVRVFSSKNPEKAVKAMVTEADGDFKVRLAAPGQYVISFSSIGKQTIHRNFTIDASRPQVDLGKILIAESSQMLKGVNIVAQRALVKAEIDKIAYNVEEDPDSKTNTALEMLRKVPMVTVDGDDNIQLNGSGSFKVHVNGKPNTLMSNNPSEVLRSLPANSIKSIEVITEPGAKYDAEGIGGILNIITVGTRTEGYNVNLGTNVSNTGIGANGYGTVQLGKFMMSANYAYNYSDSPKGYEDSGREDFTSDQNKHLHTAGWNKNKGFYQYGSLEASYEIDSLNLITLSAGLYGGTFRTRRQLFTDMQSAAYEPVYSYHTLNRSKMGYSNYNANLDYQHSFKTPGEYLTLSYKFDYSPNANKTHTDYTDLLNVPYEMDNQFFDNDAHTSEHTVQVDYVNPISKYHYIDAGMKYIFRSNESESRFFLQQDGILVEDLNQTNLFDQGQNILAAYADYQLKWKKLGFKAGARYEHTFMDVDYKLLPERDFSAQFNDIVPTANLAYMFSPASSLRANYNLRINRPSIWYLNPFRDNSNPGMVKYGNPDLDTEKAHLVGLTYSTFSAKFSANIGLNYMFTNNGIESYSFMNDGLLEQTYRNAGKKQNTSLNLWVNWNPGRTTRLSVNATGTYADYKSEQLNTHNSGFSGNLFGNLQQTLPWKLKLSAYGGGSTPSVTLQGKGNSYYYYGLSCSRTFLKDDRLNVSVKASNFLNKYNTYRSETTTDTFHSWNERKRYAMKFGLSVSWRFGDLKAKVKETVRSINNDDVKAGGENAGGGGQSKT